MWPLKQWIREGLPFTSLEAAMEQFGLKREEGGQKPLELLDTDLGSRQVEDVLGRIEHGVYS